MQRNITTATAFYILIMVLLSISSAFTSSVSTTAPTEERVTHTFTPSIEDILNPERGFYHQVRNFNPTALGEYASQGHTLAFQYEDLRDYIQRDLPQEYLEALAARFKAVRQAGLKVILRFAYNRGYEPGQRIARDAPLQQVLRHIQQLEPVLEANKDVIAWIEAGFIGAWGEWHSSQNRLDTPENKAIIRDALFRYFPKDRFILFRYPGDFIRWFPQPLTEEQAFTQTPQARTGHHNDCFLADDTDVGTYYDIQTGRNRAEEWKAYISKMGRFVPICGETCKPDPPRPGSRFDCENALQEMEYLHWSALDDIWHPDVIRGWKDKGCFREISKRLGYRLTLLRATFSPKVRAGSELQVKVVLQNTGFASPLLERPVYLLLIGQDSILRQKINVDPRRWLPGEHTFDATLSLPANLPPGDYSLALWLPDPAPTLQNDPRYSIRFANENTWDAAHGWNVLGSVRVETTTVLVSFSVVDRQKRPLEGARLSVIPNLVGPDDIRLRPGGTFTLRIPDVGKYEFTVEWTSPFGTTAKATVTDTPAGLQARGSITLPVDDVTVQVVDINGRPVAKAFIKFGGRDVGWTDGQGVIVIERVPLDQDYTVVVIKDGVEVGGYRYRFTSSSRSTTIQADIYDIAVLVKGSDGQPIQGALVELFKAGKMIARAATDSSGTAVFTKVVGADYEVRASYEQFSSKASLPKGTHSAQITLDLYTVLLGIPMTYTILLALIVGLILFTVLIAVIMSQKLKQ